LPILDKFCVLIVDFAQRILLWKGRNDESWVFGCQLVDKPFKITITSSNFNSVNFIIILIQDIGNNGVFLVALEKTITD